MKELSLIFLIIFNFNFTHAQVELDETDLNNLVSVAEYYSQDVTLGKDSVIQDLEVFRTEKLSTIINTLQTQSKRNIDIFEHQYLQKPTHEELVIW